MKLIYKIAIVTGLIVSVSSCQKENLPNPGNCTGKQENVSNQRVGGSNNNVCNGDPYVIAKDSIVNEVVGGGDDDRDGGGKKEPKKGQ